LNKILITGSSGFLGNYLLKYFERKLDCYGVSRGDNNIDISNYNCLRNVEFSPKIILHVAASLTNEIENGFTSNVIGTFNICKFAKQKKTEHIIFISTISIYNHLENQYYNNYALTKKQSEEVVVAYCKEYGINLTILRLSQVYDTKKVAIKSQKMLYHLIDNIKLNKSLEIYGEKNPIRNYVHIKDILKIVDKIIFDKQYGTYNVVNNESHSIKEIGYMIFDLLETPPKITFLTKMNDIPTIYVPTKDTYPLCGGYFPLRDGIEEILNYEQ